MITSSACAATVTFTSIHGYEPSRTVPVLEFTLPFWVQDQIALHLWIAGMNRRLKNLVYGRVTNVAVVAC